MKHLLKRFRNDSGQAMILFALVFVVIIGFAAISIDIGSIANEKSKLQNAADAAALAGSQDLPSSSTAITTAKTYAARNGVTSADTNATVDANKAKITVVCSKKVQYAFARVFGFTQNTISATATATKGAAFNGVSGLRPWALSEKDQTNPTNDYVYTYGLQFRLKEGGGGGSNGYFGCVSFGAQKGDSNTYKDNITDGYDGVVHLNDQINTANGNMNVKQVINALITKSGDTAGDYTKAQPGDSRVVLIPKINSSMKVIGFAVIYLKSVDNQGYITANFLYDTTWSEQDKAAHNDWGLNSPKLVN